MTEQNSKKPEEETDKTPEEFDGEGDHEATAHNKRTYPLPKDLDLIDPGKSYAVPTDQIYVPKERVTSVYDAALEEEFHESVRSQGIKDDVILWLINGALWLDDGLHRIQSAEKLGIPTVPAKIQKGSIEDLLMSNIVHARQRGKSNPAQEAQVLEFLTQKRGFPISTAAKTMGMSEAWAQKLLKIAPLPEEIRTLMKLGKIPVTGAFYIADLPTPNEQLLVARDAAQWGYSVYQIKAKVSSLLNPDVEPTQGEYTFNAKGKPNKIPIRCRFCGSALPDVGKQYIWVCGDCEGLAADLLKTYFEALNEVRTEPRTTNRPT